MGSDEACSACQKDASRAVVIAHGGVALAQGARQTAQLVCHSHIVPAEALFTMLDCRSVHLYETAAGAKFELGPGDSLAAT